MVNDFDKQTAGLCQQIGYLFDQWSLLERALTHRSVGAENNERLEFLGDGALNFVVASELYRLRPEFSEGELSRMRAKLVRKETLVEVAHELNLGTVLNLGVGELKSGGFQRDSILADSVEALIGAVYIDGGFESCYAVVLSLFSKRFNNLPEIDALKDPKTRLQEYLQASKLSIPQYVVVDKQGKSHEQQFVVQCVLAESGETTRAQALGRRRAEQLAAVAMLEKLGV